MCGYSRRATEILRWIFDHNYRVVVPTPILVECTTGSPRDAEVNRVLAAITRDEGAMVAPDEATARLAGALRFRARSDDGVDALVAATAVGDGTTAVLLTSDAHDLERLLVGTKNVVIRKV